MSIHLSSLEPSYLCPAVIGGLQPAGCAQLFSSSEVSGPHTPRETAPGFGLEAIESKALPQFLLLGIPWKTGNGFTQRRAWLRQGRFQMLPWGFELGVSTWPQTPPLQGIAPQVS